ncbi:YbaN family protein [Aliikangiella maris]|uniref:Inner membrane protein n=2 Tax=Aliikangiella maris TaxID=3162458 RepID=A0ABV3MS80_9GAMM
MSKYQRGAIKYILILTGLLLVMIGFVGIFVPGLPTTIFLIGAAACFAKSSPCLHAWLLSHRWFGPILYHWKESRSIPKKAKIIALSTMALACLYSGLMIEPLWVRIVVYAVMIPPAIFVYRLPLSENTPVQPYTSQTANSDNNA